MKRRDFLKVSGAALVATQLPLGQEKEQKFSEGSDGTRYYELDVSQFSFGSNPKGSIKEIKWSKACSGPRAEPARAR